MENVESVPCCCQIESDKIIKVSTVRPMANILHDFFLTLASEPLLVILALRRLERRHLLLEILEGAHRVAIEPARKLRETNNRVERTPAGSVSRVHHQTEEFVTLPGVL
jgi:hypothetical protein